MKDRINYFKLYGKSFAFSVGSFVSPYLILFIVFLVCGIDTVPVEFQNLSHLGQAFYTALYSKGALACGIILTISITTVTASIEHFKTERKLINELDAKVDNFLTKTKIVFESGINEYNDSHLMAVHNVLKSLEEKCENESVELYAIDNTDPRTWWSDTMTGYLALLAKWKSDDTTESRRSINRIFVCKKNELLSPVFAKTISLHSLMGFKTFIIDLDTYVNLFNEYAQENNVDTSMLKFNKELLLWSKVNETNKYSPIALDFKLDGRGDPKDWKNVKCYQSFWDIDSDYFWREKLLSGKEDILLSNYYRHQINSKDINIWFEFISITDTSSASTSKTDCWQKLPEHYFNFIKLITAKAINCHDKNCMKTLSKSNFNCIEIKTSQSYTSADSEFVPTKKINEILQEYYSHLNK